MERSQRPISTISGWDAEEREELKQVTLYSFTQCADPDPGSGAFLTHGSGMGKKSRSGSGMTIPDKISESLETVFFG